MNVHIKYDETPYLKVNTISVIGSFNGYDKNLGQMKKSDGYWFIDLFLSPGEYRYKFLINDSIKLNDPTANIYLPDENDELWSVILINSDNQRLYNNTQYTLNIENYSIGNTIQEEPPFINKKVFNITNDKKVVTRFEFTNITGLHSVTVLWFDSNNQLFDSVENVVFQPLEKPEEPIVLWFWLDINKNERIYPTGIWTIKLFVNGEFILEDKFQLDNIPTYSSSIKSLYL